jgi:hypothetical protein
LIPFSSGVVKLRFMIAGANFEQVQYVVVEFETHIQDFVHRENFAPEPR